MRRLPKYLLVWCFLWLLLAPVGAVRPEALPVVAATPEPVHFLEKGALDDDEDDFQPPQDIYVRPHHREDFSLNGWTGDPVVSAGCCAVALLLGHLIETELTASSGSEFLLHRTLDPRAPPLTR